MQDKDTEISRLKSELKKRDKEIESLNNKIECGKVDKKELRAALKKKVDSSIIRSREKNEFRRFLQPCFRTSIYRSYYKTLPLALRLCRLQFPRCYKGS